MRRYGCTLMALLAIGCGESTPVEPEPEPLEVTVTAEHVNYLCTIEWKAVANDSLRLISYHVGFGTIDDPTWHEVGTFQGSVTERLPGPAPNNNVTFLLEADGYRRAGNIGPSGVC